MKHHLIKKMPWHKKDDELLCTYCHNPIKELKSNHFHDHHYKETVCNHCKSKVWVKISFNGCGNDKLSISDLEEKII